MLLVGRGGLDGDGHGAELFDEGLRAGRGELGGDVGLVEKIGGRCVVEEEEDERRC